MKDKKKCKERLKCVSVCQLISEILVRNADGPRAGEHTDHHCDWNNSNMVLMRQDDTES